MSNNTTKLFSQIKGSAARFLVYFWKLDLLNEREMLVLVDSNPLVKEF